MLLLMLLVRIKVKQNKVEYLKELKLVWEDWVQTLFLKISYIGDWNFKIFSCLYLNKK